MYAAYVTIIPIAIYSLFLMSTLQINFSMVFLHVHSTRVLVLKNITEKGSPY